MGTLSLSGGRTMHCWCFTVLDAKVTKSQLPYIVGIGLMATFSANESVTCLSKIEGSVTKIFS
jgi:hypothetical protein